MPKTTQLTLTLQSKPGVLARVTRALADAGVNITALSAGDRSSSGKLRLVVNDPGRAKRALKAAKLRANEEPAFVVRLRNKPGTVARVAEKLARARINIKSAYATTAGRSGAVETECNRDGSMESTEPGDKRLFSLGLATVGIETYRRTIRVEVLLRSGAVEGEACQLEHQRVVLEVHQLDVVAGLRVAVRRREPEVAFARHQRGAALHDAVSERIRHEIGADRRDIGRLESKRRHRLLRRKGQHVPHRGILGDDSRFARREPEVGAERAVAEVVAAAADGIEDSLSGIEKAEAVR